MIIRKKVIKLKNKLSGKEMVDLALQCRERERCCLSALDDMNDPGETHHIIFSNPRDGDDLNSSRERQVAKTMYGMFTAESYGMIHVYNDVGFITIHPAAITISTNWHSAEEAAQEPPAEMVQTILDLLPAENIESINDEKQR